MGPERAADAVALVQPAVKVRGPEYLGIKGVFAVLALESEPVDPRL